MTKLYYTIYRIQLKGYLLFSYGVNILNASPLVQVLSIIYIFLEKNATSTLEVERGNFWKIWIYLCPY